MWWSRIVLGLVVSLLTACATGPQVLSADVQTSEAQGPGAAVLQGARYSFEAGLGPVGQPPTERLQAMAQMALARVGAVRDDVNPRVSVKVSGTVNVYWMNDWGPYGGWSNPRMALGLGFGGGGGAIGLGYDWPMADPTTPIYISQVSLLMRDVRTGQIVYDTRARHDGTWGDADQVLRALFVAALQGYPQPAQAMRRVNVPLYAPAPVTAPPAPATPVAPAR